MQNVEFPLFALILCIFHWVFLISFFEVCVTFPSLLSVALATYLCTNDAFLLLCLATYPSMFVWLVIEDVKSD